MERIAPLLIPLLGAAFTYFGYGPFSKRRNPNAGAGLIVLGLALRLIGALFLTLSIPILIFMLSMTGVI